MANSKLTGLSATTTPVSTDIFYIVTDPGGTPTSLKVTGANMGKALTMVGKVTVTQPASSATLTLLDGGTNAFTSSASIPKYSTDTTGAVFEMVKARGTGTTTIVTGDVLGDIDFYGHDGSNSLNMARIRAVSTGTIASTRVPTALEFYTATNAAPSVLTKALTLGADQTATFVGNLIAPKIINSGSANTAYWTGTGYSITGSGTTSMIDLAGTLNTSGATDVIKIATTVTAAGTGSKLLNLYGGASGTTSVFSVGTTGAVAANGSGTFVGIVTGSSVAVWRDGGIAFTNANGAGGSPVINLSRTSDGVFQINNGTLNAYRDLELRNLFVKSGGSIDLSAIAAGSPNLVITATSDTPGTAWNVVGTNNPSAAPSGYLEISVGGSARYIPFYA